MLVDSRRVKGAAEILEISNMARTYSFPDGHWNWPVLLTHKHGVRHDEMVYTGGQVDLDPQGNVLNPDLLEPQVRNSMNYLRIVLEGE